MNRIWGINYDIAVLTNITQDHLDLHKTMKDYVSTKLKLFKNLISYKRKK
jgi:UDP-N-acetylmuramoylalanine-D-glutamate ligase